MLLLPHRHPIIPAATTMLRFDEICDFRSLILDGRGLKAGGREIIINVIAGPDARSPILCFVKLEI